VNLVNVACEFGQLADENRRGDGAGLKNLFIFLVRFLDKVERWSNLVGVWLIIFLMLLVSADVTYRTLTGQSIVGAYELAEIIMVGVVFFTLAYCQKHKGHVRMEIIVAKLQGKLLHFTEVVALLLCLVISVLMSYQALVEAKHAVEINLVTAGIIEWPAWPLKLGLAYGLWLFTLRIGTQLAQQILLLISGEKVHAD
jgi:TRAP-type C4-dicarboxylate transport system permease small subunit